MRRQPKPGPPPEPSLVGADTAEGLGRADLLIQQTLVKNAVEEAEIAVLVFDETGHFVAANDAAATLTGYARDSLVGMHGRELAGEPVGLRARFREVVGGERVAGSFLLLRADGARLRVAFRVARTTVCGLPYFLAFWWPAEGEE